jgi:4-aminobutyrate aminotransferase-like enzyme
MIPPLNVTEEEMQQGLDIFAEAVKEVAAAAGVKGA